MLQRVVNKKKERFVRLRLFEYYYSSNIVLHWLGYVFFFIWMCVRKKNDKLLFPKILL